MTASKHWKAPELATSAIKPMNLLTTTAKCLASIRSRQALNWPCNGVGEVAPQLSRSASSQFSGPTSQFITSTRRFTVLLFTRLPCAVEPVQPTTVCKEVTLCHAVEHVLPRRHASQAHAPPATFVPLFARTALPGLFVTSGAADCRAFMRQTAFFVAYDHTWRKTARPLMFVPLCAHSHEFLVV